MIRPLLLTAGLLVSLAACGGGGSGSGYNPPTGGPTPIPVNGALSTATLNGSAGFVNTAQSTVYTFDADTTPNQSTCGGGSGGCAGVWPPVQVTAGATLPANWTAVARTDGIKQLAYKGKPLYTYVVDTAPGQTKGDGILSFGNTWHIARP